MAVRGLKQIAANLRAARARILAAERKGRAAAGAELLEKSRAVAPVDTGALRTSGFVELQGEAVVVGYTAPYAPMVHEDLAANHAQGRAKFLEEPARQAAPRLLALVAAVLRKAVEP